MSKMEKVVLIGGGGHAKVVIDTIRSTSSFEIAGIIDEQLPIGSKVEEVPVIGKDQDLQKLFENGIDKAFVAIGSLGSSKNRKKLVQSLEEIGFDFPSIVHNSAYMAPSVNLGKGVFVAAGTVLQSGTVVGDHAIINTRSSIDHDCQIGSFTHIAPGCVLSGGVTVGDDSHLGTGSVAIEYRKIGQNCLIGAGSVVVNDLPDGCKAFGNPCKIQSS